MPIRIFGQGAEITQLQEAIFLEHAYLFLYQQRPQRMKINGTTTLAGVNTTGFIGIATNNPLAPLTISGSQNILLNAQSWRRGLNLKSINCPNKYT